MQGRRLRVVDETGADVPPGTAGELVEGQPGRTLMLGYLGNPEATARALEGGWLRTGDLVRRDHGGDCYFVDRAKDMIKKSGENAAFESAVVAAPGHIFDESIRRSRGPRNRRALARRGGNHRLVRGAVRTVQGPRRRPRHRPSPANPASERSARNRCADRIQTPLPAGLTTRPGPTSPKPTTIDRKSNSGRSIPAGNISRHGGAGWWSGRSPM